MFIHSYHIFMFPFSLKNEWKQNDIDAMLQKASWERKQFDYKKGDFASNFSEQGYFYDFGSGALFDDPESQNRVLSTYQFPVNDGDTYTININKKGHKKSYILSVEKIEMNIYDDKAAILCFHLQNYRYTEIQDILYINDYGRRIYPQFLVNDEKGNIDLSVTKSAFLADSICLKLNGKPTLEDNYSSFETPSSSPYKMPAYIQGLLPETMHDSRWLLDDRMYVVSYFTHAEFAERMKRFGEGEKWLNRNSVEWDWYQYVFVDNEEPRCQNEQLFKDLLRGATYARWSEKGSFFGVSKCSFTCLIGNDYIDLLRNVKTMYYRMASLALAQRVLSLNYSREISEISKELDENKLSNKQLRRRVNELNRDYLRFVNNVYFREITPQEQGIDLYDLMQKQMNVKRDEEGLSREVEQLYHYVTMANEEQRNNETEKLGTIATWFLIPTLITGIWGMNLHDTSVLYYWFLTGLVALLATIIFFYLKSRK